MHCLTISYYQIAVVYNNFFRWGQGEWHLPPLFLVLVDILKKIYYDIKQEIK